MKPRLARFALSAALVASAFSAFAQSPTPSVVTGEDWTFPFNVEPLPYSGLFRGENQANPPESPVVGEGIVNHIQHHYTWIDFNNGDGVYTFTGTTSQGHKRIADVLDDAWDPVAQKPRYLVVLRLEVSSFSGWNGKTIPLWVTNKYGIGSGTPSHTFRGGGFPGSADEIIYVAPWHPGVQAEFNKLIREICKSTRTVNGFQYMAHPALAAIFLHGCSGSRGEESTMTGSEWTSAGGLDKATASATHATGGGYPTLGAAVQDAWQDRVDFWKQALIDNGNAALIRKVSSVGGGQWQNTSYDGDAFEDYVIAAGMGLRHGSVEKYFYSNGMPPKAGQTYVASPAGGGYIVSDWSHILRNGRFWGDENEANIYVSREAGSLGVNLSRNRNEPDGPTPDGVPGPVRDLVYRSPFIRAASMGMNFLWAGPWQIRYGSYDNPTESATIHPTDAQLDQDFVDGTTSVPLWFTRVAGKGPATSPDAVCWLRQASVMNVPGAPEPTNWKNMERLLMQRDLAGIDAVTTATDTKKMPDTINKNPASLDEQMARRTDFASGNRKIAFKLHPDFKASLVYPVQIKVTFKDTSATLNNAWNVTVANAAGTQSLGNVAMNGNGQWKTATFTVQSANAFIPNPTALGTDPSSSDPVDDPAGIDFVIQVPSASADLTVRYVRVVRMSPPGSGGGGGGGPGDNDANDLTITTSAGDSWVSVTSDPLATGGDFVRFDGNAVNDFITFDVANVPAGTYDVAVRFNNNTSRGIYQLAIDDGSGFVNQGSPIDLFTSSFTWTTISFGNKTLTTTGTKKFRFTATSTSGTGYKAGIDLITLTPIAVAPEVSVVGNGVAIFNGDSTPQVADNTDFGATDVVTGTISKDFSILNTGTATLTVSGAAATGDFGILTAPGGSVAPGASTNFTVAFNPTAAGVRTGTVSFDTNDANNDPFVFSVQGAGTAFAAIDKDANSLDISATSSGDTWISVTTDPGATNHDFIRFDGNAVNDFITFDVPVPASDTYQISGRFNNNTTRGIYQLAINNGSGFVDLGTPKDLYSETFVFAVHNFGTVALTEGARQFRFTAVGTHDETSGYKIGVDLITLTPLNGANEINVTGNGATIADGDTTPTAADHTDFGTSDVSGATVTRTFTIQNTGTIALSVGSVSLSGTHAADYSVITQPASSVAAGGSTTFDVRFDPSAAGTRTASVSFTNGDANESPYNFSLQGTGFAGTPEINVQGNSTTIADGDTTPTAADHSDFGAANINGGTVSRTFTIQNTGAAALTVGTVTVSGTHASNFTVTTQPAASVAAGGSTTFVVQFDPSATGVRTASLSFSNNDANENPYNFSIQGTGTQIAWRAASSAFNNSNVTSVTVNKPSGLANNDTMIAAVAVGDADAGTLVAPSGWTLVRTIDDAFRLSIYVKKAGASEPANYQWTWPGTARKVAAGIAAFSGVNTTTPIQAENGTFEAGSPSTTHSTPTITTTGSACWIVTIFADNVNPGSTWTPPSGLTERVDVHVTGSVAPSIGISTTGPVAAGVKGPYTATSSNQTWYAAMQVIALQP